MKNHLISTLLFTATYVLSKGTGDVQSPSTDPMSLDQLREPGKGLGSEGDFFRLILQYQVDEGECKHKLEKYCDKLREADSGFARVPKQIKNLCAHANTTSCKTYLNETQRACSKLGKELEQGPLTPSYTNCSTILPDCLLLQGFCGDDDDGNKIKKECNELLNKCHDKLVQNVYDYIFLREFAAWIYSSEFLEKFRKGCLELKNYGEGFIRGCLNSTRTHERLKRYHDQKCDELNAQIDITLSEVGYAGENDCKKLGEECHFYGNECNKRGGHKKSRCPELQQICSSKGRGFKLSYTDEDLPKLTLYQRLNIKAIFDEALKFDGLILGPPHKNMNGYELLFWLLNHWNPGAGIKKCSQLQTGESCSLIKYYSEEFSYFCRKGSFYYHGPNVCSTISSRIYDPLTGQRPIIQGVLKGRKVPPYFTPWLSLNFAGFSHQNCRELSGHCTFLTMLEDKNSQNKGIFGPLCDNLQRLCYKEGRRDGFDLFLVDGLIEYLFDEHRPFSQEDCLNWLFYDCETYNHNYPQPENMHACAYPMQTCDRLGKIIDRQCVELQNNLAHNLLRNETFCRKLSDQCELLSPICHPTNVKGCDDYRERCFDAYDASDLKFRSIKTRRDFMRGGLYQRQN